MSCECVRRKPNYWRSKPPLPVLLKFTKHIFFHFKHLKVESAFFQTKVTSFCRWDQSALMVKSMQSPTSSSFNTYVTRSFEIDPFWRVDAIFVCLCTYKLLANWPNGLDPSGVTLLVFRIPFYLLKQGCQIFLGATYQKGGKYTK
jgi:hypothetical protein